MKILQENLKKLHLQTTDYTCGPVTLLNLSIASNLELQFDEFSLAKEVHCSQTEWTTLKSLGEFAKVHLHWTNDWENTWNFQSACIAIITDKRLPLWMRTHAVAVFWLSNNQIVFFCPYFWELIFMPREEFISIWHSEDFKYTSYSINIKESLIPFIIV